MKRKQRSLQYEFVRCVAFFLMVGVHVNARYTPGAGTFAGIMQNALKILFLSCNAFYFLLSGKFALNTHIESKEDLKNYYKKKITGLILPILFFMLVRTFHDFRYRLSPDFLLTYFRNVGCNYVQSVYWFLYILLGNLLLAPFLAKAFQNMSYYSYMVLVSIAFLFNVLVTIAANKGLEFSWTFPLQGWSAYFLLGYGIERLFDTKKKRIIGYILSLAAYVTSVFLSYRNIWACNISDLSPLYLIFISGFYVLLCGIYTKSQGCILDGIVRFVGKYSFAGYMVHIMVLDIIGPFFSLRFRTMPVLLISVIVLSLFFGALLQFLIIRPITSWLNRIWMKG